MADRGMNEDLFVVGDRVVLYGLPARWLSGDLRPCDLEDYAQGQRGTVLRIGDQARNLLVSWDDTEEEEWIAACCLRSVIYSSGLRDGVPEPYSAVALRSLPGASLAADVAALVNGGPRADQTEARDRLNAALRQRRLFTVTLPRHDPPPREEAGQ